MLVYVDTNVFLDFLRDRDNEFGGSLGARAERFFRRVREGEFDIVVSDWVKEELSNHLESGEERILFSMLEDSIVEASYSDEDWERAREIDEEEADDILHAVIADNVGADLVTTQNISDYGEVDFIDVKKPRDI
jgi:predicted nucleic acid-binding protein